MGKHFITYDLAVKLKKLGFNEECFGFYDNKNKNLILLHTSKDKNNILAPLWQQAFDWLLPKLPNYNLDQMESTFDLRYYDGKEWSYVVMLGTRQACLEKLIEIVENENN